MSDIAASSWLFYTKLITMHDHLNIKYNIKLPSLNDIWLHASDKINHFPVNSKHSPSSKYTNHKAFKLPHPQHNLFIKHFPEWAIRWWNFKQTQTHTQIHTEVIRLTWYYRCVSARQLVCLEQKNVWNWLYNGQF